MRSELIRNRARAKQLLAFDGMQYGKCRPTDIDVSLDFQGETFVFVELKGPGAPLTLGQRIHLEALVKGLRAGGKEAVAILAESKAPDPETDVHVAEARVLAMYDGFQWVQEEGDIKLDTAIHFIHNEHLRRKESK